MELDDITESRDELAAIIKPVRGREVPVRRAPELIGLTPVRRPVELSR